MFNSRTVRHWLSPKRLTFGLTGVGTVIAAFLAGHGVEQALLAWEGVLGGIWTLQESLAVLVVFSLVTFVLGMATYDGVRKSLRTRAKLIPRDEGWRAGVAIMTLSLLDTQRHRDHLARALQELGEIGAGPEARRKLLDRLCRSAPPDADQEARAEAPFTLWKWQQPLRLLRHHSDRLDRIVLILSEEVKAEKEQVESFECLAGTFLKPSCAIEVHPQAIDMEDYNGIERAIYDAVEAAESFARGRGGERSICIDISGGQKVWSAVAVLATINTGTLFSYVQTDPPYDPLFYDGALRS